VKLRYRRPLPFKDIKNCQEPVSKNIIGINVP
jgi:hypothetical protein